ncbi:excinuclease ATPase subunit [Clostridium fermenticellae]|uniref:Excinuclease ATPase subunit n=1 Tax=Clostridium fermenticellae TaxID=2068654 RepID=A0A386H3E8_9CLOT|nr:excinuclease ATPase subunit [Clostridium fermenticellae]AYD40200.1 excinuclease ATPase subunit [Clostridium fermenticellae]
MSYGAYFMYYKCPKCGKKFKYSLDADKQDVFGQCDICHVSGVLIGEGCNEPENKIEYEDISD